MVYRGLTKKTSGTCKGMYQLNRPGKPPLCTHGPDPAPKGVDVTKRRTVADMVATSGDVVGPAGVPCIGDGTSGSRVQAIYAVASDKADRFGSVRDLIAGWAGAVDAAVSDSADATGGVRHIRFVTNPDCSLDLDKVVLSATGDDSFECHDRRAPGAGLHPQRPQVPGVGRRDRLLRRRSGPQRRQPGLHQPQQHPDRRTRGWTAAAGVAATTSPSCTS